MTKGNCKICNEETRESWMEYCPKHYKEMKDRERKEEPQQTLDMEEQILWKDDKHELVMRSKK